MIVHEKTKTKAMVGLLLVLIASLSCLQVANLGGQQSNLLATLDGIFPETEGFFVASAFKVDETFSPGAMRLLGAPRIIVNDPKAIHQAPQRLNDSDSLTVVEVEEYLISSKESSPVGYWGILVTLEHEGERKDVQFLTHNLNRWLIWAKRKYFPNLSAPFAEALRKYAVQVSDYLKAIDENRLDAPEPKAVALALDESLDFYAEPPPYVIEGYDEYKGFLHRYDEIKIELLRGITGFIPTRASIDWLIEHRTEDLFENKEVTMLQREFRSFIERGGDFYQIRTLTPEVFATLEPGIYFFAVGKQGRVRFGYELPREQVIAAEKRGVKLARANHALLFPGERVLAAGEFEVELDSDSGKQGRRKIVLINTASGHYFYSNKTKTIRQDISVRSDYYFLSIGHFLMKLDEMGIPYDGALLEKM